jgi:DNA-binding response OmpR family regulator
MAKAKILIVDDEPGIRDSLSDVLVQEGYQVVAAENGENAINLIENEQFDLMLLDIMMPGMSGVDVLRVTHRKVPDLKVILLTAHGTLETAVEALRLGAHDYLLKPASAYDILASISRGLASRAEKQQKKYILEQMESSIQKLKDTEGFQTTQTSEPNLLVLEDNVMFDVNRREIWQGDVRIGLTPTEGKLLRVLVENRGRVLSHRELVFQVQGYETTDWEAPEVLRPLISRLRRKLAIFDSGESWISNVRGTGYLFDPSSQKLSP